MDRRKNLSPGEGWALATLLIMTLIAWPTIAAEAPLGEFYCEGTNAAGGGRYRGTVEVEKSGDTYRVVWRIAGQTHHGTALMYDDVFAVALTNGQAHHYGLAVYRADGDNWYGRWTEVGAESIGTETWKKNQD